jgi:molecular chaperone GrpE
MPHTDDGSGGRNTDADRRTVPDDEVEPLRQALDEEEQRHLRLRADFDNVRRRTSRELEAARRDGQRATLLPLLSVLDSLERALAGGYCEGVAATHRLFVNALHEARTDPIDAVGKPFDPIVHEAAATIPSGSIAPGMVVREVRRGWQLGVELLRPSQVLVAAGRETAGSWR